VINNIFLFGRVVRFIVHTKFDDGRVDRKIWSIFRTTRPEKNRKKVWPSWFWPSCLAIFWPSIRSANDRGHRSSSIVLVFVVSRLPQSIWRCVFRIPFLSPFLFGKIEIADQFLDESSGLKPSVTTAVAPLQRMTCHLFCPPLLRIILSSWLQSLVVRFASVLSALAVLSHGAMKL